MRRFLPTVLQSALFLALSVACLSGIARGQSGISGDALLLQGFEPQIEFNDNDGNVQRWFLTGDDFGFVVEDLTNGTSPFRIDPAAPTNALRVVNDAGDANVGIGGVPTADVNLHIREFSSPTIRLHHTNGTGYIWDMTANNSEWSVNDITGSGTIPFSLAAGLPSNALRVSKESAPGDVNIGIGGLPTDDINLHIRETSSPTIRLHQTSGTGYQWDIVANSGEFFLQDVTGNTFPFSVAKAAPSGSFRINANGNTGFGTSTPSFPLHVVRTTATAARIAQFTHTKPNNLALVAIENDAAASPSNFAGLEFLLNTSLQSRVASRISANFSNITDGSRVAVLKFSLSTGGTAFEEVMRLKGNNVGIGQTNPTQLLQVGSATCNGTIWANASSRTLKHDISELSLEAAREAVMALEPVTYAYNQEPQAQRVGFIAEDVPELVALPGRETLSSLDIVAALTRVVQEQERQLVELQAAHERELTEVRLRLQTMETRLAGQR
jgi:predicted secreted protein